MMPEVLKSMNEFIRRTRAPAETDNHWINTAYGGLNECIVIDRKDGSVLPNCTGYAWGRMYELIGSKPLLPKTDAKTWYPAFEGYARGRAPALGAVACWAGTKYGHVAIVESIGPDYIMCSQSNYGGARFEYVKCIRGRIRLYLRNGKHSVSGIHILSEEIRCSGIRIRRTGHV